MIDPFAIQIIQNWGSIQTYPLFYGGFEGLTLPQTSRVDFGMQTELVETDARRSMSCRSPGIVMRTGGPTIEFSSEFSMR